VIGLGLEKCVAKLIQKTRWTTATRHCTTSPTTCIDKCSHHDTECGLLRPG